MEKLGSALCQLIVLYTHYFNFYLNTFYKTNNIKKTLVQRLKLIFKFGLIKRQINIPL